MENNPPLGPLPSAPERAVSAAQRVVLSHLVADAAPVALTELAQRSGLHENTLRGHLAALVRAGLVRRETAPPTGRGRPALLWAAVPGAGGGSGAGEYAGLATALARTVRRTSSRPAEDAALAGRAWGHDLVAEGTTDPQHRLREVLDQLGFAPEDAPGSDSEDSRVLRLTRCPLLDVARELPEVVCSVHQGLVDGVLEATGGAPVESRLLPFAEPGACVLTLTEARR